MESKIRKHYFLDTYVIIAPDRRKRRHELKSPDASRSKTCFFCPKTLQPNEIIELMGKDGKRLRGKNKNWKLAVLINLFPALSQKKPGAYGIQEIIVETEQHGQPLENLPVTQITELLDLYARRNELIKKDKKIKYIITFKNQGEKAGASIAHAHSQIMATDFVPPKLEVESRKALAYQLRHGVCPYCDIIKKETRGPRFIAEKNGIVALAPYTPTFDYEAWLLPKRHVDNISELTPNERQGMAGLLKNILKRLGDLGLAYNFYLHDVLPDEHQHGYIKITPRHGVRAGFEFGSGVSINSVSPETAARYYRKQFKA